MEPQNKSRSAEPTREELDRRFRQVWQRVVSNPLTSPIVLETEECDLIAPLEEGEEAMPLP